jgi:predicted transposase/invertase (TIGR01784 family)
VFHVVLILQLGLFLFKKRCKINFYATLQPLFLTNRITMAKRTTPVSKQRSKAKPIFTEKQEANKYDKIIKENLKPLLGPLFRRVLGLNFTHMEFMPITKQQTTIEREPDFICLLYTKEHPEGEIAHVEFQTGGDTEMADRMLENVGIERRRYKKKVRPFVVCLDADRPYISNEIHEYGLNFMFPVFYLCDEPYQDFLQSENPEEVILAILANFEGESPEDVIKSIVTRLKHLEGDIKLINRFFIQLRVIAKIRNLQPETYKIITDMVFQYNIEEDIVYQEGEARGEARGKLEGKLEGDYKRTQIAAFKMFDKGFMPSDIADLLEVPLDLILKIQKLWKAKRK